MESKIIAFEKGKTTSEDIINAFSPWCQTVPVSIELFAELMANVDRDLKGNLALSLPDKLITFEEK